MTDADRQLLEEIREQNNLIIEALRRGGMLAKPEPRPVKGAPSVLQVEMEADRLNQIYKEHGPKAFKAAMKERNAAARARRNRQGRRTA